MDEPITTPSNLHLSFVACVSSQETLHANLLASLCLRADSPHELILVKNCLSAADGFNLGIERAKHDWVVCLHQDVWLPAGWDRRLCQQLESAMRQFGPTGVAGVYGSVRRDSYRLIRRVSATSAKTAARNHQV